MFWASPILVTGTLVWKGEANFFDTTPTSHVNRWPGMAKISCLGTSYLGYCLNNERFDQVDWCQEAGNNSPVALEAFRYKNHLNSSTLGPSLSCNVGTSFAVRFTPCRRLRLLLSHHMYRPKHPAARHPVAPKHAVVIRAGAYFGASFS